MAQRVEVLLIDDLDGSEAQETVKFGLDGANYEIDLSGEHAEELRAELRGWAERARKTGRRARAGQRVDLGPSPQVVRAWARANGYQMSNRGRVAAEVREAYDKAHPSG